MLVWTTGRWVQFPSTVIQFMANNYDKLRQILNRDLTGADKAAYDRLSDSIDIANAVLASKGVSAQYKDPLVFAACIQAVNASLADEVRSPVAVIKPVKREVKQASDTEPTAD
jgi:hypothetical protein